MNNMSGRPFASEMPCGPHFQPSRFVMTYSLPCTADLKTYGPLPYDCVVKSAPGCRPAGQMMPVQYHANACSRLLNACGVVNVNVCAASSFAIVYGPVP